MSAWHRAHQQRSVQSSAVQSSRYLRRCTFCASNAVGDERHCVFDCLHFQGLRQQHAETFQEFHNAMFAIESLIRHKHLLKDARDSMRNLMWHQNQKALSDFVIANLDGPRT